MKKIKFLSLLLVPLMSLYLFVGCGQSNKSSAESKTLYEQMISKNSELFNDLENPNMLKMTYTADANTQSLNDAIYCELPNNTADLPNISIILGNNKRFMGIHVILEPLADYIFNYYKNWNDQFYLAIDDAGVSQNELNTLYSKLDNLNVSANSFKLAKAKFESDVSLANNITDVLNLSINKYNYAYAQYLYKAVDFVMYFKDLHVKYVYNVDAYNLQAVKRLFDEYYLNIAYICLNENVVSLCDDFKAVNGACDLSKLLIEAVTARINTNIDSLTSYYSTAMKTLNSGIVSDFQNITGISNNNKKLIDTLKYYTNIINQRRGIYTSSIRSLDMYQLAQIKLGNITSQTLETYYNSLSQKDKSYYNLKEFYINNCMTKYKLAIDNMV